MWMGGCVVVGVLGNIKEKIDREHRIKIGAFKESRNKSNSNQSSRLNNKTHSTLIVSPFIIPISTFISHRIPCNQPTRNIQDPVTGSHYHHHIDIIYNWCISVTCHRTNADEETSITFRGYSRLLENWHSIVIWDRYSQGKYRRESIESLHWGHIKYVYVSISS